MRVTSEIEILEKQRKVDAKSAQDLMDMLLVVKDMVQLVLNQAKFYLDNSPSPKERVEAYRLIIAAGKLQVSSAEAALDIAKAFNIKVKTEQPTALPPDIGGNVSTEDPEFSG